MTERETIAAALDAAADAIDHDFRENINDVAINDEADHAITLICNGMYRASRLVRARATAIREGDAS
jgi:hypothetical protein